MGSQLIGWVSSGVLVATLIAQVRKQYKAGTSEGVSKWLFVGQLVAWIGFTVYSVITRDWVFVVTNSVLIVNALAGFGIMLAHRRRKSKSGGRLGEGKGANPRHRSCGFVSSA